MWLSRLRTQLVSMRMGIRSLDPLSGLRIRVAASCGVGQGCGSVSTPSPRTSTSHRCGPKKPKNKKDRKEIF